MFTNFKKSFSIVFSIFIAMALFMSCFMAWGAAEKVSYRLKWIINASVMGDIYAKEKGFFAENGLDVDIKSGGPEYDAITEIELGRAEFGTASADQVIRAISKGASITVIAQLFQVNPLQWIYRSDKIKIESPKDLKGKVIGITYGGNDESIMNAILAKYEIKDFVPYSVRQDYTPFYKGKVDLWPIYKNSQGILITDKLAKAGETAAFLDPNSLGVKFVANSVITSTKMLNEKPETVQNFLAALIKGWEHTVDAANIDEVVNIVHKFDDSSTIDSIKKQVKVTATLIKPSDDCRVGNIDIEGWKQTEKIMLDQKLIAKPVNIEKYLRAF